MSAVHGYVAYTRGCRCQHCRLAKAAYMRAKRAQAARARAEVDGTYVAPIRTHGYPGYQDAGCRCATCVTAKYAKDRERNRSRVDERTPEVAS